MKKNNTKLMTLLLGVLGFFISCDDIFEEEITDEKITLIFPEANDIIEGENVTFQWEDNKDIDEFRLRVRTEDNLIVLDTLVTSISFATDFELGNYCWKVRGENSAFETPFSAENCFALSAPIDLEDISINLSSPANEAITNNETILFRWNAIENASNYEFKLFLVNDGVEEVVVDRSDLTSNSIQLQSEINEDGVYRWEVRAVNTSNNTATESQERIFTKDTEAPRPGVLLMPTNSQTLSLGDIITLSWSIGASDEEIVSEIQIARDAAFSNIIQELETVDKQLQVNLTTAGTYYWRVKGTDEAENEGGVTNSPFSFQLNQQTAN